MGINQIVGCKKKTIISIIENKLDRTNTYKNFILEDVSCNKDNTTEFLEFTPEMLKKVDAAFSSENGQEVLTEMDKIHIKRAEFLALKDSGWLTDNIINFYFMLLSKRVNSLKVYAMNSFFYPKLKRCGQTGVRNWTKNVDIFSYDIIIIPIHSKDHWSLCTVNIKDKLIYYLDSLQSSHFEAEECFGIIKDYLFSENIKKKKEIIHRYEWNCSSLKEIPQQANLFDCGIFVCLFAEYICANKKLMFSPDDIYFFRCKIAYEILTQKILVNVG